MRLSIREIFKFGPLLFLEARIKMAGLSGAEDFPVMAFTALSRKRLIFGALAGVGGGALVRAGQLPPGPRPIRPRPFPIAPLRPLTGVVVSSVEVEAKVSGGVATIQVAHVFANRSSVAQEGDFLFPIPEGAIVREFALYDGETKLDATLLEAGAAGAAYEEIVRRRRDPALLTYAGRAALRVRAFPVAPGSERRVKMTLTMVLPSEGGSKRLTLPLAGPHLPGGAVPERASVKVRIEGAGSVYSPTHDVSLRKGDDGATMATWSSEGSPGALTEHPEMELYLAPAAGAERAVALSMLACRAGAQGYFMIVATPNLPRAAAAPPRRVVLVMDRSGSMAGKKIEQARGAMKAALGRLKPSDAFNILTFSDKVETLAPQALPATPKNIERAMAFADDMSADGGTNIHEALLAGLGQFDERRSGNTLLFFTDGLPTVGVRDQKQIVKDAVATSGKKARCFAFGVGYDVDVPFLDAVSGRLRGDADYVRPDEDIEVKTSRFVAKTGAPSLENLRLEISGARVSEIFPPPRRASRPFSGRSAGRRRALRRRGQGKRRAVRRRRREAAAVRAGIVAARAGLSGRRRFPAAPLGEPQDRHPHRHAARHGRGAAQKRGRRRSDRAQQRVRHPHSVHRPVRPRTRRRAAPVWRGRRLRRGRHGRRRRGQVAEPAGSGRPRPTSARARAPSG